MGVVLEVAGAPADHAGEAGRLVAESTAAAAGGRVVAWMPGFDAAERYLRPRLRSGDLCVMLGAGNVDELARALVA